MVFKFVSLAYCSDLPQWYNLRFGGLEEYKFDFDWFSMNELTNNQSRKMDG